jgi:hypothetical protein
MLELSSSAKHEFRATTPYDQIDYRQRNVEVS